jgi:hypothetical protein
VEHRHRAMVLHRHWEIFLPGNEIAGVIFLFAAPVPNFLAQHQSIW